MSNEILQKNLYWQLLQVSLRAKHGLMRLAEKYDLAIMQMVTLCSLEPGQPEPTNWVSCVLACDASNATGIVDRLIAQGYVSRQENPKDRRVKMITLTPKGKQLRETLLEELKTYDPGVLGSLSETEKAQLHTIVTKALQVPEKNLPKCD